MEKALRDVRKETLQQKTDLKPQEELIKGMQTGITVHPPQKEDK